MSFADYIRESLVLAADDADLEMTDAQVDAIAEDLATSIENYSTACAPTPTNPALDQAKAAHADTVADLKRDYAELARLYEVEKEMTRRLRRDVERFYR